MIRVAVISGKGGTGKTMVTAALAEILPGTLVLADCDVDAANLGLYLSPETTGSEPFMGMKKAMIDPETCTSCDTCREHCRFGAVVAKDGNYQIDPFRCEGCGVCVLVCPAGAVALHDHRAGEVISSRTSRGNLVSAKLEPGEGNSGLLVHAVKARAVRDNPDRDLFLIDGPPGTGCPLISTASGTDAVLIVTEPSVAGIHDLERVVAVCRRFKPRIFVAINRFDLDCGHAKAIEDWCRQQGLIVIGTIPFDPAVLSHAREGIPVTRDSDAPAAQAIRSIAERLQTEVTPHGT